jgi:hypothetical protein
MEQLLEHDKQHFSQPHSELVERRSIEQEVNSYQ